MTDTPLFEAPDPPEVKLSAFFKEQHQFGGKYNKYKAARHQACDECVAYLHENKGVGPAPLPCRWLRVPVADDSSTHPRSTLRLCTLHKELWQQIDKAKT